MSVKSVDIVKDVLTMEGKSIEELAGCDGSSLIQCAYNNLEIGFVGELFCCVCLAPKLDSIIGFKWVINNKLQHCSQCFALLTTSETIAFQPLNKQVYCECCMNSALIQLQRLGITAVVQ